MIKISKQELSVINKMLIPIMIEQTFLMSIGLLISFFLKQTGTAAVAAIGLMTNFNMVTNSIFQAFGICVAVTVAQFSGRDDARITGRAALQGFNIGLLSGLLISALCLIFKGPILHMLLGESELQVYEYSIVYYNFYLVNIPFILLQNVTSSGIRGSGHPKESLIPIVLYNGLYAALSGILTLGFDMGFKSVCIAQSCSAVIAGIVGSILLLKGNDSMQIEKYALFMDSEILKPMVKVGIPVLLENTFFAFGRMITQTFSINFGTDATAANGLVNNINGLLCVPVTAAVNAVPPIVGKYCGQGDKDMAMKRGRQLTQLGLIMQSLVSVVIFIIIKPVCAIMTDSANVQNLICQSMYLLAIIEPVGYTLGFMWPAIMRSAGDGKYVMLVNSLTMIFIRVGVSYLLTHVIPMGIIGIWIGQCADWFVRIIFFAKRFRTGKWLEFSLFDDGEKVA